VAPVNYAATGDKVGIFNSGNSLLNNSNAPYTVTADSTTAFHFTVNTGIAAATYSGSNNACGPLGTADCLRISKWAYAGQPFWDGSGGIVSGATQCEDKHLF